MPRVAYDFLARGTEDEVIAGIRAADGFSHARALAFQLVCLAGRPVGHHPGRDGEDLFEYEVPVDLLRARLGRVGAD